MLHCNNPGVFKTCFFHCILEQADSDRVSELYVWLRVLCVLVRFKTNTLDCFCKPCVFALVNSQWFVEDWM